MLHLIQKQSAVKFLYIKFCRPCASGCQPILFMYKKLNIKVSYIEVVHRFMRNDSIVKK